MTRSRSFARDVALRAGVVQALTVASAFLTLALALPRSFFEDWGAVAGPTVWIVCTLVTARVLRLPVKRTLIVAAVAGLLGGATGRAVGHDVGIVLGLLAFALLAGAYLRPTPSGA